MGAVKKQPLSLFSHSKFILFFHHSKISKATGEANLPHRG